MLYALSETFTLGNVFKIAAILTAVIAFLTLPLRNRHIKKKDILFNVANAFEGYFHSCARHSVYNTVRLADLHKREIAYLQQYNLIKQIYDTSLMLELRKDYILAFSPEVIKKVMQFELLSRNFNSDLEKFVQDIKPEDFDEEQYKRGIINLVDKNIRLFMISDNCRDIFEKLRMQILDPAIVNYDKIKNPSNSKLRLITVPIFFVVNIILFLCSKLKSNYYEFTGRDGSFDLMQKRNEIVDEINFRLEEDKIKIKQKFDSYISKGDTRLRSTFKNDFDQLLTFMEI